MKKGGARGLVEVNFMLGNDRLLVLGAVTQQLTPSTTPKDSLKYPLHSSLGRFSFQEFSLEFFCEKEKV